MTLRKDSWLDTFEDPATLSSLLAAARACMAEGCDDDPDQCVHPIQLVTPGEFAAWVQGEVLRRQRRREEDGRSSRAAREHMSEAATQRHARTRTLTMSTA